MNKQEKLNRINEIFSILSEQDPHPKTELEYINPYTLVVAVALSAQATDIGVNKATKKLFKIVQTPEQMLELGIDGLKEHIRTIGLYNSKAKNIIALSAQLIEKHNSVVPENLDDLIKLPGVGIKTAMVVLNCAFNHPLIAVDTHVYRVGNRLGLVKTKSPEATIEPINKIIPDEWKMHAHHWLILHGRYVCKARKPICQDCQLTQICNSKDKNV